MKFEITNLEQAKAYFFTWGCSSFQMSRDGGPEYGAYRSLVTPELENEWTDEYLELLLAQFAQSPPRSQLDLYCAIAELFSRKSKTSAELDRILAASRQLQYSDYSDSNAKVASAILENVFPHLPKFGRLQDARELLKTVELFMNGPAAAAGEKLLARYRQCADAVKEIRTVGEAKQYFIRKGCSRNAMKYDYREIVESYAALANEELEREWIQEAFERSIARFQNREQRAADHNDFLGMIRLYASGAVNRSNTSALLDAARSIREYGKAYFYAYYARGIMETVIPALAEHQLIEEAAAFLAIAKDLLHSTPELTRDWRYREALEMAADAEKRLSV